MGTKKEATKYYRITKKRIPSLKPSFHLADGNMQTSISPIYANIPKTRSTLPRRPSLSYANTDSTVLTWIGSSLDFCRVDQWPKTKKDTFHVLGKSARFLRMKFVLPVKNVFF